MELNRKKEITVAFVTNNEYAPYLSTAIYSLIANRNINKRYHIFVFYTSLSEKSKSLLSSLQINGIEITFIDFEQFTKEYYSVFYTCAHYTKETYYRLFIPKFFGDNFGNIIYLDVDLVVNRDIAELLDEVNNLHTIYGTINYSTEKDYIYIQSLGLSHLNYINAGVMVIDCNRFNKIGYFDKATELIKQQRQFIYLDQDILNTICVGDIGIISPKWNVQWNNISFPERFTPNIRNIVSDISQPYIVHYTIEKPWQQMLNPLGEYYKKYAALNPIYSSFFKDS